MGGVPADPHGRPADPRAVLVLGACATLALGAAVDAALLPHVDRAAPRALGLFSAGVVLALGALFGAGLTRATKRGLLGWALLVLGGGLLAASWTGAIHARLLAALANGSSLPYHALVVCASALAALPVALPLGALLELVLRGTGRARLPFLLGGAGAGCLALPYLAEVLLGHADTLRLAALVGAAASLVAIEHAPLVRRPLRLAKGRTALLAVLGAVAALTHRQTLPSIEFGSLGAPWFVALLLIGAALGCVLAPRSSSLAAACVIAACALPLVPDVAAPAVAHTQPGLLSDALALLSVALPLGLVAGLVLGRDEAHAARAASDAPRGAPLLLALPAAWVLVPTVSWVLLPTLGARGGAAALAVLAWLAARAAKAHRAAVPTGLVVGGALLFAPFWPRADGLPVTRVVYGSDGNVGLVHDPVDDADHLAFDGRAVLGLSAPQRERLVDVPLLLAMEPERVLVVAADRGDAAARALLHRPREVDWLTPVPPLDETIDATPFLVTSVGSERLFLAGERPPWDALVMLPDPRARRRAALTSTVEFYEQVESRLSVRGLFCQWWDAADTEVSELRDALSSAQVAFPFTYLVMDHPRSRRVQLGVLGTRLPLELRTDRIEAQLSTLPRIRRDLSDVGLDAYGLACLVLQHPRMLAILAPPENALHDERTALGVLAGLAPVVQPDTLLAELEAWVRWRCDPMAWIAANVPTPQARLAVAVEVRDRLAGWQRVVDGTRAVIEAHGVDATPFENLAAGEGPPEESWGLAASLRSLPDWTWAEDEVRAFAARLVRDDLLADAEGYLREAVRCSPSDAELHVAYGDVLLRAGEHDEARAQFERALQLDPGHPRAHAALATLGG